MDIVTETIEVDKTRVACDGGGGPLAIPAYFCMGRMTASHAPIARVFVLRKQTSDHAA